MRLHYLQHEQFEDPGTILEWAAERGHTTSGTMIYKGEPLPSFDQFDLLAVMGGSLSVNDEKKYPWLATEKKLIKEALCGDKLVLGICLGAQLMAAALGARVYKNPCKEIGWFPVTLTPHGTQSPLFKDWPLMFQALHWHGDTFDIPERAERIAYSKACWNQAFVYGRRAVALQFHLESTSEGADRLLTNCENEVVSGHLYIQHSAYIRNQKDHYLPMRGLLFTLLDVMEKCP